MLQATAKPAADTSLDLFSAVEQQTATANKALAVLPAVCTRGTARSIQEAKVKVCGDFASCSVAGIIKNIAYIMIDAADFGSAVWVDGEGLVASVKACFNEDSLLKKVECLDDALSNSSDAIQDINEALRQFAEQLFVIVQDIEDEIKTCQGKSAKEYKNVLNALINEAKAC